jgi:hypothetical protein
VHSCPKCISANSDPKPIIARPNTGMAYYLPGMRKSAPR